MYQAVVAFAKYWDKVKAIGYRSSIWVVFPLFFLVPILLIVLLPDFVAILLNLFILPAVLALYFGVKQRADEDQVKLAQYKKSAKLLHFYRKPKGKK